MPAAIPFVKANACGNDFLIIDGMHAPADLAAFTRRICDRHDGVGADGVEWLFPATDADIKTCSLVGREGPRFEFEMAMGEPQYGDPFSIKLAFGEITGVPVSMGNPHFVVF